MLKQLFKNRKGAALVEYGLLIGGIALIAAGAVSIFGHKTSDMIATVAAVIPGAHTDDNASIVSGKLIETTAGTATAPISLDFATIQANGGNTRLGDNIAGAGTAASTALTSLVVESNP